MEVKLMLTCKFTRNTKNTASRIQHLPLEKSAGLVERLRQNLTVSCLKCYFERNTCMLTQVSKSSELGFKRSGDPIPRISRF